jgi:hypothetical protein
VSYVVEIESTEDDLPLPGSKFKDCNGNIWTMRGHASRAGLLRLANPPPPLPRWEITIQPDHPASILMNGQRLEPEKS